jgi:hypothetical protein
MARTSRIEVDCDPNSTVIDIAPAILEVAGIGTREVNGVPQKAIQGISMAYTFGDEAAPGRRITQYFEMLGNRALCHDSWVAGVCTADCSGRLRGPVSMTTRGSCTTSSRTSRTTGGKCLLLLSVVRMKYLVVLCNSHSWYRVRGWEVRVALANSTPSQAKCPRDEMHWGPRFILRARSELHRRE